jgi:hypothetical protein
MADNTNKMLQAIINGQSAMKSELLTKIGGLDKKIDGVEARLTTKIDKLDEKLTKRIDKIGISVAKLQDDAPTVEEFDRLEARVKKVEVKVASV